MTSEDPKRRAIADDASEVQPLQRWSWLLDQNLPVIGGWMHRRVLTAMTESALRGNALAVHSLALAVARHPEADVRALAQETLRKVNFNTGIDAIWKAWSETRNPDLMRLACETKRIAAHPASIRLLSALAMPDEDAVTRGSSDLIPALIIACGDPDAVLAERARQMIRRLRNPHSIDHLCRIWLDKRDPFLTQVLQESVYVAQKPARVRAYSALKVNRLDVTMQAPAGMIAALIEAAGDRDKEIAGRARQSLLQLQKQLAVDVFCKLWSETRSEFLSEILDAAAYTAHQPVNVKLLVDLKHKRMERLQKIRAEEVVPLLEIARADVDETFRQQAQAALATLQRQESRDMLLTQFLRHDDGLAQELAARGEYLPGAAEDRALYLFLTEHWADYDLLDFDLSLLRTIYAAASPDLRRRIAARVQAAGRSTYLPILTGTDHVGDGDVPDAAEAALMVKILSENEEYERLWKLVPSLTLAHGIEIIKRLSGANWHPRESIDQPLFNELAALAPLPMVLDAQELGRILPPTLPRAHLQVKGRVNEVAFAPHAPLLAIATSQRKVILWNFQTASIVKVLEGFKHSVGKVSFLADGSLVCGERTNSPVPCPITLYRDDKIVQLTAHQGSITALQDVHPGRLLSAGRDGRIVLWDMENLRLLREEKLDNDWARALSVAPDGQSFALLSSSTSFYRLPELKRIAGQPFIAPRGSGSANAYRRSVAQDADFSPDGKFLAVAQYNGQVAVFFHNSLINRPPRSVLTQHKGIARGVCFLKQRPVVVSAGSEGHIRFSYWPGMTAMGLAYAPEGSLTSLHVAPNGAYMATGSSDASLRLWDLRVMDIAALFAQPLGSASQEQAATTLALASYEGLPEAVRNGLKFMRLLLQYRFRFDIHLDEATIIQAGRFDIAVEDAAQSID